MKFTQRCTHHIETPSMVKPFPLESEIVELGVELIFEYHECSFSATLSFDVSHLRGPASNLIFKILSDDVGVIHYSRTTLFSNPKYSPEHEYQNCGNDVLSGTSLFDLLTKYRFQIADEFINKMFDNITVFPYHENGPLPTIEYGPEYRKGLQGIIYGATMQLAAWMPSYQAAYKIRY